jgi:hypothetical protein
MKIQTEACKHNWADPIPFHLDPKVPVLVLGADVTFFREAHKALVLLLESVLSKSHSRGLLVAPDRDGTLTQFQSYLDSSTSLECKRYPLEEFESTRPYLHYAKASPHFDANRHHLWVLDIRPRTHQSTQTQLSGDN